MKPDAVRARELEVIHAHSIHHRADVERSERCGCFYCEAMFASAEIVEWVYGSAEFPDGDTALCPRCDINAVLPSAVMDVTPELLSEMRHWVFLK